jgi:hypothetical protein
MIETAGQTHESEGGWPKTIQTILLAGPVGTGQD